MSTSEIERLVWVRDATQSGKARRLRESNHLSLGDIASAIDTHETTVWKWETNRRRPASSAASLRYADLLRSLECLNSDESAEAGEGVDRDTATAPANAPPRSVTRSSCRTHSVEAA